MESSTTICHLYYIFPFFNLYTLESHIHIPFQFLIIQSQSNPNMENQSPKYSQTNDIQKQYKPESIVFSNTATNITVMSNGFHRIIRKQIKLTAENKEYAEYQIKLMKAINHPHVVRHIYHKKLDNKKIYLYMPYYQNKDLEDYLKFHDEMSFEARVQMFIDILVGIKELHSKFIIHRDLKLKNIFVDQKSRCVIGDLGISICSAVDVASRIGTPTTQAPEVYSQMKYDQKVDLWALGIIAYQLFNQKKKKQIPFPFKSEQELRKKILSRNSYGTVQISHDQHIKSTSNIAPCDQNLPDKIKDMISSMLQNNVEKRPSLIEFYEKQFLFDFDCQKRLATFVGEYKSIAETKTILKKYIQEIVSQRPITIKLSNLLNKKNINKFVQKYSQIKKNILDISILLFGLMERSIKKYNFIIQKHIFKFVKEQKPYFKFLDRQIFELEQKINYVLRERGVRQIRKQPELRSANYISEKCVAVEQLLTTMSKEDKETLAYQQFEWS